MGKWEDIDRVDNRVGYDSPPGGFTCMGACRAVKPAGYTIYCANHHFICIGCCDFTLHNNLYVGSPCDACQTRDPWGRARSQARPHPTPGRCKHPLPATAQPPPLLVAHVLPAGLLAYGQHCTRRAFYHGGLRAGEPDAAGLLGIGWSAVYDAIGA